MRVPYFGVLIVMILLAKGTILGSPIFGNSLIITSTPSEVLALKYCWLVTAGCKSVVVPVPLVTLGVTTGPMSALVSHYS